MSDGGRERASVGVEVWTSSQKWSVQRSAVRSIAWLDLCLAIGGVSWQFFLGSSRIEHQLALGKRNNR